MFLYIYKYKYIYIYLHTYIYIYEGALTLNAPVAEPGFTNSLPSYSYVANRWVWPKKI